MDTTQDMRTYPPTAAVRQAVQDAQHMLTYAVESKLTIADHVIAGIVRAKNIIQQEAWNPAEETQFWKAFTALNIAVKAERPVTVRSLRTVLPRPGSTFWQRALTRGNVFLFLYGLLVLLVFLTVIILQTYWFIGNGLLQEIERLTTQRLDLLRVEHAVQERAAGLSGSDAAASTSSPELDELDRQLKVNHDSLLKWSKSWKFFLNDEHTFEGKNVLLNEQLIQAEISRIQRHIDTDRGVLQNVSADQRTAVVQRIAANEHQKLRLNQQLESERRSYEAVITRLPSQFVLEMLQSYILPMLYGLLGASIYVLRAATREIDEFTYTMGSDIRYELRLALGALGGLGIGWFLVPEDFSGLFQVLSPLALSLIVGYNIEVLFSMMDSVIDTWAKAPNESD